jgi:hypothetical protein
VQEAELCYGEKQDEYPGKAGIEKILQEVQLPNGTQGEEKVKIK